MKAVCVSVTVLMAAVMVRGDLQTNGNCADQYVQCRFWARAADYCSSEYYGHYMGLMCPQSCNFCNDEGQKQLANLPREEEGSVPSEDEDQTNGLNEGDLEDISQKITDISQKVTDNPNAPVNIPLAKLQGTELVKDEDDDVTSGSASQHGDEAEDDALPVDNQRADNALPSGEGKGQTSVKTKSRESVDHDVKSTFVSSSGASGSGELSDPVSGSGGGNSETDKNDSEEDDDDDDEDDDDDDDDNDDDSDYGDGGEEGEDRELSKRSAILTPETWGALASLVKHELSASTSGDDEDRDLEMLEDPDDSETDTDEEAESDPGPSPDSDEATDEDTKGTRQRSQIAHPEVTSGSDSDVTSGVEASGTGDSRDSSVESVVPRVSAQSSESGEGVTSGDHQADVTSPGHVTTKADDDVTPTSHATDSHVASKSTNEVASGSGSPSSGYQQDATSRSRVTNNDVTSGSAVEQIVSLGQEVQGEQEDNAHDIEDAIFDKGLPLTTSSGQASSSEQADQTLSRKKKPTFDTAEYRRRLDLIEKMMKAGKFRAFQVSHKPVRPSARDEVPHKSGDRIQSDVGKGARVSFVLNQDFQDEYSNDDTAGYDILAQNLKDGVEKAAGNNAVVSNIRFTEVRNPDKSPQFSKIKASFKLRGDVKKLRHAVRHGSVSGLVVQRDSFKKVERNDL